MHIWQGERLQTAFIFSWLIPTFILISHAKTQDFSTQSRDLSRYLSKVGKGSICLIPWNLFPLPANTQDLLSRGARRRTLKK